MLSTAKQQQKLKQKHCGQTLVAHTCNPSFSGDRSGGTQFEASLGK
jgi:hypothetical protein